MPQRCHKTIGAKNDKYSTKYSLLSLVIWIPRLLMQECYHGLLCSHNTNTVSYNFNSLDEEHAFTS